MLAMRRLLLCEEFIRDAVEKLTAMCRMYHPLANEVADSNPIG